MENCGNFLEYAAGKCGIDVGYGKMILVYPAKTTKYLADLTAANINIAVASGEIIGIIKGWHTIAGAPVAELNVERTGTTEMKLIRQEIAADVLTFESNLANREVLSDLVAGGSFNALLIDDQGSVFGESSNLSGALNTMLLNFSGKTTSALQGDNVTDKSVAITVRYLVKELDILLAEIETELIVSKKLVNIQVTELTYAIALITAKFFLKNKATGKNLTGTTDITGADINFIVDGAPDAALGALTYVSATGLFTLTLTSATSAFTNGSGHVLLTLSTDTYYMKQVLLPTVEV